MKRDVIRRRRTTSFRMIACVHHRRASGGGWPGSDGHPGGTSDRRVRTRRDGRGTQMDVAAVRVDGRHVAAVLPRWWGGHGCGQPG